MKFKLEYNGKTYTPLAIYGFQEDWYEVYIGGRNYLTKNGLKEDNGTVIVKNCRVEGENIIFF